MIELFKKAHHFKKLDQIIRPLKITFETSNIEALKQNYGHNKKKNTKHDAVCH